MNFVLKDFAWINFRELTISNVFLRFAFEKKAKVLKLTKIPLALFS